MSSTSSSGHSGRSASTEDDLHLFVPVSLSQKFRLGVVFALLVAAVLRPQFLESSFVAGFLKRNRIVLIGLLAGTLLSHVVFTCIVLYFCRQSRMSRRTTMRWVLQTLLYGYSSARLLLQTSEDSSAAKMQERVIRRARESAAESTRPVRSVPEALEALERPTDAELERPVDQLSKRLAAIAARTADSPDPQTKKDQ